jgi:hypothetical protein
VKDFLIFHLYLFLIKSFAVNYIHELDPNKRIRYGEYQKSLWNAKEYKDKMCIIQKRVQSSEERQKVRYDYMNSEKQVHISAKSARNMSNKRILLRGKSYLYVIKLSDFEIKIGITTDIKQKFNNKNINILLLLHNLSEVCIELETLILDSTIKYYNHNVSLSYKDRLSGITEIRSIECLELVYNIIGDYLND